jgi:transcriptional regulator GlxA family with amidase domain
MAKITEQVGDHSTETYARNFQRREGLPPAAYRNMHNG